MLVTWFNIVTFEMTILKLVNVETAVIVVVGFVAGFDVDLIFCAC